MKETQNVDLKKQQIMNSKTNRNLSPLQGKPRAKPKQNQLPSTYT